MRGIINWLTPRVNRTVEYRRDGLPSRGYAAKACLLAKGADNIPLQHKKGKFSWKRRRRHQMGSGKPGVLLSQYGRSGLLQPRL